MYDVQFYLDIHGQSEIVAYLDKLAVKAKVSKTNQHIRKKLLLHFSALTQYYADYMEDESRVSPAERAKIDFEIALIGKVIEAREAKGISQRQLAELSGIKQPAIARLERM